MTYEEAIININALNTVCGLNGFYNKDFEEALKTAIETLEKQTPKKVVRKMGCHGGALCPNCRTMFEHRMDNWKSPFCQYCGQALEWEEVE